MWAFNSQLGTFTPPSHNGSQGFIVYLVGPEVMCPGCDQSSVYAGSDTDLICVKCEKTYFIPSPDTISDYIRGGMPRGYDNRPLTAMEESFLDYISSLGATVVEMLEQLPKSWTFDRG